MTDVKQVDMTGKVCLVTGGNSGIGKESAVGLAKLGATVVIVSRNADKGEAAVVEIRTRSGNQDVELLQADLSSQDSVRQLADEYRRRYKKLHVLLNNAGIYLPKRIVTVDGLEATFATNHLGHFLLTNLLLDLLKTSAPSRIINITSSAHYGYEINFEDLMGEKKFSSFQAYGRSKLANVLFTYELAKKLEGTRVTVNCLHPGVVRTGFGKDLGGFFSIAVRVVSPFMMSPEKSARAAVYLATAPELENVTGKHFSKGKEEKSSKESYDPVMAEKLWQVSAELTKLDV
ncbi:MAG TPA: SDR family oxidoreductase [Candidatus Bathyarchaeia archaeon]|nr:SDR family oxidoreductase [Candidatus Bathyarchaeia archaeon]